MNKSDVEKAYQKDLRSLNARFAWIVISWGTLLWFALCISLLLTPMLAYHFFASVIVIGTISYVFVWTAVRLTEYRNTFRKTTAEYERLLHVVESRENVSQ